MTGSRSGRTCRRESSANLVTFSLISFGTEVAKSHEQSIR